jgi:hypothetical protein
MLGGGEQRRLRRGSYGNSFAAQSYSAETEFNVF